MSGVTDPINPFAPTRGAIAATTAAMDLGQLRTLHARGHESDLTRTILLIDDVRLRRECLFYLLRAQLPDFEVLAVAPGQPFETWKAALPDIILVCAPRSGHEERVLVADVAAIANGAPVLLLTETEQDDGWSKQIEAGVAGRFPTTCGTSVLIAAIQLVLVGGRFQIPTGRNGGASRRDHG